MISVDVTNPLLTAALLSEVVRLIDTANGLDQLLQQGCDPALLDEIRNSKVRDMREIAAKVKTFRCVFSPRELAGELRKLQLVREDQELCEYFIRHGANRNIVADLWNMTFDDVAAMRRVLLPGGGASAGRPQLPRDFAVREAIHQAWSEILKAHPEETRESRRRRVYLLHQRFSDLTIDTLHCTITEFDTAKDKADRRLRRRGTPQHPARVFPLATCQPLQANLAGGPHAGR